MSTILGDSIFKDIESNEYLQEIYNAILFNYSLNLFRIPKKNPAEFDLVDALRFADLLSKSTDPTKAELHKVWAQEIVALLNTLYPQNESVKFIMGSVLTNVCNYRGLSLHQNKYVPNSTFEKAYEEYKKSILKIPSQSEGYFFKSQRAVFDSLSKDRFSYSGPTSMGKSFVMRVFIKEQIVKGIQSNFAIVVPTKALINEVSSRIITDLKELLAEKNYRVVTAGGAIALQQEHNFILALTPERLLYLLLERPDFKLDYLFIDEAHKISSKGHGAFYDRQSGGLDQYPVPFAGPDGNCSGYSGLAYKGFSVFMDFIRRYDPVDPLQCLGGFCKENHSAAENVSVPYAGLADRAGRDPGCAADAGADISTWDFILSQGSGNAALLIWMAANAVWGQRRKKVLEVE